MIFTRQVNLLGSISYSIFSAVPFLYELRALLDWSCTATTLTLFDWLKLEDINTSLFLVTVNRKMRERRRLGQRQPRYLKFFQVIFSRNAVLKTCNACLECLVPQIAHRSTQSQAP